MGLVTNAVLAFRGVSQHRWGLDLASNLFARLVGGVAAGAKYRRSGRSNFGALRKGHK